MPPEVHEAQSEATVMQPSANPKSLMKDIVHQASNQLAVVRVVGDPHVVLSGVHAKLQVGFTQAPTRGSVVLMEKHHSGPSWNHSACMALIRKTSSKWLHDEGLSAVYLQRRHDGVHQFPLQIGSVSQMPLIVVKGVVQVGDGSV